LIEQEGPSLFAIDSHAVRLGIAQHDDRGLLQEFSVAKAGRIVVASCRVWAMSESSVVDDDGNPLTVEDSMNPGNCSPRNAQENFTENDR